MRILTWWLRYERATLLRGKFREDGSSLSLSCELKRMFQGNDTRWKTSATRLKKKIFISNLRLGLNKVLTYFTNE